MQRDGSMATKTGPFSLDNLAVFDFAGVASVTPKKGRQVGCNIKLDNGWSISVLWGPGNYGSNYDAPFDSEPREADTVEIAVLTPEDSMVRWTDGDNVQGWVTLDRLRHIIGLLAEERLVRPYLPPPPEVEMRAHDGWPSNE